MTTMTDSEIEDFGFQALVDAFGEVYAERFITLVLREPQDYTKWREGNMYLDGDLHAEAEKAREAGRRFRSQMATTRQTVK